MKYVVITGISTGFGNYLAHKFLENNFHVIGSTRNLQHFCDNDLLQNPNCTILELDLGDSKSISNFSKSINEKFEKIDILINNAGFAVVGAVEETSIELFRKSFEINVIGPLDLTKKLLPMIRQSNGVLINISSLLGVKTFAGFGTYSASKFALEGLTESLGQELKKFGVKTVLIEPGAFKTNFATESIIGSDEPISDYSDYSKKFKFNLTDSNDQRQSNIDLIWQAVLSAIDINNNSFRIMVGEKAQFIKKLKTEELSSYTVVE